MEENIILNDLKLPSNYTVDLEILESIDSTNEYLKKEYLNNQATQLEQPEALKIVLAQEQTQGKGRFDRIWVSPFGQNIYFSCLKRFNKPVNELSGLSLVVSLAIAETLEYFIAPIKLSVKWPNDVFYKNAKLSGTLIEILPPCAAIIGIGININMENDVESNIITKAWTSLKKITHQEWDRNQILSQLINTLVKNLNQFEEKGFESFLESWQRFDCLLNQKIGLKLGQADDAIIAGIAKGVNAQGHLLLELPDGRLQAFASGDTSILNLVYY